MKINFNNRNDKQYEDKLNNLLKHIFIDFTFWYDLNLWDENYESYSIMQNDEIVSNICVFKSELLINEKRYGSLSVGAVATREDVRGKGYLRLLMEYIISKYPQTLMYLSANDTVLDFYPRFGFERVYEKLPISYHKIDNRTEPNKLRFDDPRIIDYLRKRVNVSSKFDCLNTASVNMFHIHLGHLKEHIYFLPKLDTIVIAEQKDATLKLIGVFSLKHISFIELAKELPFTHIEKIEFGFMPCWDDLRYEMVSCEADPFFMRKLPCELGDYKFPELSVT